MKDRFPLDTWPTNWIGKILEDFPKLNRETRLFLAKAISVYAHSQKEKLENEPNNAMEPTPVNVTVPADAGTAPLTSVAHLRR